MSDFFDIFASCCGERKPGKAKIAKEEDKKDQKDGAPLLDSPRARILDPDIKDFLKKCSGVFRLTLSPIPSVGSSLESPRELSPFELSFSSLLESRSRSRTPSSSPAPTPRNPLYGAL